MHIRDRIKELRRVPARELRPNSKNWRTHPPAQQDALRGVLAEVGYAGALLARELEDGSLELIDGHLRAQTTPDAAVPVLVLDVTSDEADKLLATHDPIGAMAGTNLAAVDALLREIRFDNVAVQEMVGKLSVVSCPSSVATDHGLRTTDAGPTTTDEQRGHVRHEVNVPALFQIVVECRDEVEQQEVYQRLTGEGYRCRVLTL